MPLKKSLQYYGEAEVEEMNSKINKFIVECNFLSKHLRAFRGNVNNLLPIKAQEIRYYKNFVGFLDGYETGNEKANEIMP